MGEMQSGLEVAENVGDGEPKIQSLDNISEYAFDITGNTLRVTFNPLEQCYIPEVPPLMYSNYIVMEHVIRAPDTDMADNLFPALAGLTFDVRCSPMFSTKVAIAASGKETRVKFWENPLWEFTVTFDYLPDDPDYLKNTAFKKLAGFFMARGGRFENFLFKPTNMYRVQDHQVGVSDGVNPEHTLTRDFNGYIEPIGQYDPDAIVIWVNEVAYVDNVVGNEIQAHIDIQSVTQVRRLTPPVITLTETVGVPGAGQYAVDEVTGVFTFWAGDNGKTMELNYTWDATFGVDYGVVVPRTLVFVNAPSEGAIVWGSYEYFFVCRFDEDQADFNQFMSKLYGMDELTLRSQHI